MILVSVCADTIVFTSIHIVFIVILAFLNADSIVSTVIHIVSS